MNKDAPLIERQRKKPSAQLNETWIVGSRCHHSTACATTTALKIKNIVNMVDREGTLLRERIQLSMSIVDFTVSR